MPNPEQNEEGLWVSTHPDSSQTTHTSRAKGRAELQASRDSFGDEGVKEVEPEVISSSTDETWEDAVYDLVNKVSYVVSDSVKNVSREVTYVQIEILTKLDEAKEMNQRDIQNALNCTAANVSHAFGKLEDNGHVKRERSSNDRREISVSLTAKGKKIRKALIAGRDTSLSLFFKPLKEKDMKNLCELLEKVLV